MMGTRWRLFRLLGIPVSVDSSWLIILALLTMTLSGTFPGLMKEYYPGTASGQHPWVNWLMAVVAAIAFFGCILLHELGHAVVARARKMSIRGITLFLFGGVAEIEDEPPSAPTELLMAIAGPIVSALLAALLGAVAWLGYHQGWPPQVVVVLGYLAAINVVLLIFNLIPAFPLDGGRVLRAILWQVSGNLRRATYWAALVGQGFAGIMVGWGLLNFFAGNWLEGIWSGLIGLFLSNAAQTGYQQVLLRKALEGEPVHRFMTVRPITVPPSLNVQTWVEDFVYRYHRKAFPVISDGMLVGLIDTRVLAQKDRADWDRLAVGEVMRCDLAAISIGPKADALEALGQMQKIGSSRLLVTEGGRLVGIISLKDLLRFLSLKIELGGFDESRPASVPVRTEIDASISNGSLVAANE